jgi:hypothetical protein
MTGPLGNTALSPDDQQAFEAAVRQLETRSFAARLADYAGQPVDAIVKYLPSAVNRRLQQGVRAAILRCLDLAIGSLDKDVDQGGGSPPAWTAKALTGLAGGVGGLFGLWSLPVELPLTTAIMLRAIAEIARSQGEDLAQTESRLACLEVFALAGRRAAKSIDIDYFAVRAVLARMTGELAAYVVERGALNASSPIVGRLIGEIVSRFGLAVTERAAASAIPVIGAIGGASVNVIFMDHFQRIAQGHFTIRRLERAYGEEAIRGLYEAQRQRTPLGLAIAAR